MNSNLEIVQKLINDKILITPRIIDAFKDIDRKDFVLPEDQTRAYEDRPLSIGYGATISQPTTVGIMLEKLFDKPGDPVKSPYGDNGASPVRSRGGPQRASASNGASKILEIGTGSGYLTALLAKIIMGRGKVFSIEYVPELKGLAEFNLMKYDLGNIALFAGDGKIGLKGYALFDKIISSASGKEIPKAWKGQLKVGGRIVAPLGDNLVILDKLSKRKFKEEKIPGFVFVPLK